MEQVVDLRRHARRASPTCWSTVVRGNARPWALGVSRDMHAQQWCAIQGMHNGLARRAELLVIYACGSGNAESPTLFVF